MYTLKNPDANYLIIEIEKAIDDEDISYTFPFTSTVCVLGFIDSEGLIYYSIGTLEDLEAL